ncbi:hypothetical protein [Streptomyces sp. NPDC003730]
MTKPGFTAEEHFEVGQQLAHMFNELVHLEVRLDNAYPRTGVEAEPLRRIQDARQALRRARSALEDALYRDHPEPVANTEVYFPQG